MKPIIVCFLIICCLALIGCEDNSTDPEADIINRCGIVDLDGSVYSGTNQYIFESGGDAFSFGFKHADHVCFEAEVKRDNSNAQGGTTYWCELISMTRN